MNTYPTVDAMFKDVLFDLLPRDKRESRDGDAREIVGWAGRLADPRCNVTLNSARKMRAYYAAAELLWYLSGADSVKMIKAYAPQYSRFAEDDGRANGAYGARWLTEDGAADGTGSETSQLDQVVDLLHRSPSTRQAVAASWRTRDLAEAGTKRDVPCTLSLQFLLRDSRLYLVTCMRSNDAWLGLPYDVFCFTSIQQLIAQELGVGLGSYVHMVGSMHLYERDVEKALQAAQAPELTSEMPYRAEYVSNDFGRDRQVAVQLEAGARESGFATLSDGWMQKPTLLRDCVLACWNKLKASSRFTAAMADGPLKLLATHDFKKEG